MSLEVRLLSPDDVARMEALLMTFGEAFDDVDRYTKKPPSRRYLQGLLGRESFIAPAASADSLPTV